MTDGPGTALQNGEWTIGPERDGSGRTRVPVRQVQCEKCAQRSAPCPGQELTDTWALRHAEITGHRTYIETTTALLTARPAPANPRYEQDQP